MSPDAGQKWLTIVDLFVKLVIHVRYNILLFYLNFQIKIGGYDVKDLNVKWLRQRIGVVSQEPVLFATSIRENIRYGRDDVTDAEIKQACIKSNVDSFITGLPKARAKILPS